MKPIAELHDGVQMHFPEGTPDETVTTAVHKYLGIQNPKKKITELPDGAQLHFPEETPDNYIDEAAQRYVGMNPLSRDIMEAVKVLASLSDTLQSSMVQIKEILEAMASDNHKMVDLVPLLSDFSTKLNTLGTDILGVMKAPKELYTDASGAPKGLRLK